MTERYSFTVDGTVVWSQDSIDTSTLTDTINQGYVTAEEDSPTRYLSVLDSTTDMSLDNLNITLSNPKLEVEEAVETYTEETLDQPEENNDQVVVFSVEGSDDLFGIQIVQDEDGNLQKYQFQFRKNEEGHLEAIPESITLIPMDEDAADVVNEPAELEEHYAVPIEETPVQIFVRQDHSDEHILPDAHIEEEENQEMEEEEAAMYENEEVEEEAVDIKPGLLHLQNVKQEMQEPQIEYDTPDLIETETFSENQQMADFGDPMEERAERNFEYHSQEEEEETIHEENSLSPATTIEYQEKQQEIEQTEHVEALAEEEEDQVFEHVEVNPDMVSLESVDQDDEPNEHFTNENTMNDSDENENDYEIVEGLHITGDVDGEDFHEHVEKHPTNILRHALKHNKDSPKLVKKDNKLYLYVVQHPEKENVDSLSLEMSNLCTRPKTNPRSILKSSHAMFQAKNEIDTNSIQDDRLNKRFTRCKEAVQAMLFHNFINKTTIPQAPVRKNRLPRKQKIKPVDRMDEEIVVQEVMVSSNGFVEAVNAAAGVNKENLAITEYVELTDSDDDYDPKKINRKKKKHRRKRIERIEISDESDASHDSVIELDESDEEVEFKNNNNTPPKRRRGRPPKNKIGDDSESPAKKSKVDESIENLTKPEIPCPKCDKTFPSQNSLKTHLQHHSLIKRALPEYKYKCDKCATSFINSILLKKHMCSKLFNCTMCKKKFTDLSSLNGHKRTHAKEQMVKSTTVAQVTPKKIKPVQPTASNAEFKCPKTAYAKCKTCGKLCSSVQNLHVHTKSHREFMCSTCTKTFASQLLLENHLRESCVKSPLQRRSIRIKSTSSCVRKKSPAKLIRSKSSALTPEKKNESRLAIKVKCEVCFLRFVSYKALFKHKVAEHGAETPNKADLEKDESKGAFSGIPPGKRLQNAYAELKCQLAALNK